MRVIDGALQGRDGGINLIRHSRALFPRTIMIVADSVCAGRSEVALASLHMAARSFAVRTSPKALSCFRSGGVSSKRSAPTGSADACWWTTKRFLRSPRL